MLPTQLHWNENYRAESRSPEPMTYVIKRSQDFIWHPDALSLQSRPKSFPRNQQVNQRLRLRAVS